MRPFRGLLLSFLCLALAGATGAASVEPPDAAVVAARGALLSAMTSAKRGLTPGRAADDRRLADLGVLEFGASRATSLETVGHWRDRFDLWSRTDVVARGRAPLEAVVAAAPAAEIDLSALDALDIDALSMVYDGTANTAVSPAVPVVPPLRTPPAPPKEKSRAKPPKPKAEPPVSPRFNTESLIEAVAVLPRGYWDANTNKRVVVAKETQLEIARIAVEEAALQGLDPLWVLAFVSKESAFNAAASGPFGEFGLMQLMTGTARNLAKQAPDIEALVRAGVYRRRRGSRACELLGENLMKEGKIVLSCASAPVAEQAAAGGSKAPVKADYDVEYLDLHDPRTNIRLGVRYIRSLWDSFSKIPAEELFLVDPRKRKDIKAAISAYNAGAPVVARTVARYGRPPASTEAYVDAFIENYYLKLNRRFQELAKTARLEAAR